MASESMVPPHMQTLWSVPGNRECADCGVRDPDWASINLGILICLECSGVHRSLGTHISKVRSLTLDVACWEGDLMDFMLAVGNEKANEQWEGAAPPEIVRPQQFPDIKFVREYFVRAKYERKEYCVGGAAADDDDDDLGGGGGGSSVGRSAAADGGASPGTPAAGLLSAAGEPGGESKAEESIKEGMLVKAGGKLKVKHWQQRWFVLNGLTLSYFKKRSDSYPAGTIPLADAEPCIEQNGTWAEHNWCFSITVEKRKFIMSCSSLVELMGWVCAIRRARLRPRAEAPVVTVDMLRDRAEEISKAARVADFLNKRGGRFTSWKRRWVAAAEDGILYFKEPDDATPQGAIVLSGDVVVERTETRKPFAFRIVTPSRTFYFACQDDDMRDKWITELRSIVAGDSTRSAAASSSSSLSSSASSDAGGEVKSAEPVA